MTQRIETATLAGGCFWCLEAVFERLNGVQKVVSGYIGGRHPNPSYDAVCTGVTGHAEAVRVTFDPQVLSYRDLLELYFAFQPEAPFYEAEAYHQGYYRAQPSQPYCAAVISPKVSKLRAKFRDRLKSEEDAAKR